jgi:ATP-binding cassette, subfamily B, bacterial
LRLIGYVLGEVPRAVVSYDRVARVLAEPDDPRHRLAAGPAAKRVLSADDRSLTRGARLDVEHLWFGFDPDRPVLRDVSFSVDPNRTVAVVGPTGSGKSTLLLVISGLLDATSGAVLLDGRPVADRSVDELRSEVAMAFQEPFLFGDSVSENVLLGIEQPGRLDEVAVLAGVAGFARRLPDGFATVVGERGATLSGGQRQRVALARALARRPRLLLLDDATSAVDPTTEARILAALRRHLTATTTVMVASRLSTIALVDEIVFIDEGRVIDHGAHTDVIGRQPRYEALVRAYELDRADRAGHIGTRA